MIRKNKKYSRQQTASSLGILLILVVTGAGIFWAQFDYNPAVLQTGSFLPRTAKDGDASQTALTKSIIPLPPGMVPLTLPETFDAQDLSDKINGKAELYLSAGFVGLNSQRFKDNKDAGLWMEVYLYDMGNGQNAFSVFSAQRREGAATLDLTPYAYRTQNALFLVHGNFYIEIIASEATDRAFNPMKLLAENFIRNTAAQTVTIQEKELFPAEGLVAESISLISSDAFGFDRLNQIYAAEYEIGQYQMMAYLSRRHETREAQDLASAYQKFLETFGGQTMDADLPIKNAKLVEILETYEVIFSCGPFIAGVREAGNKKQAIHLAQQLYEKLKAALPKVTGES
jgi:hypothetical protein